MVADMAGDEVDGMVADMTGVVAHIADVACTDGVENDIGSNSILGHCNVTWPLCPQQKQLTPGDIFHSKNKVYPMTLEVYQMIVHIHQILEMREKQQLLLKRHQYPSDSFVLRNQELQF